AQASLRRPGGRWLVWSLVLLLRGVAGQREEHIVEIRRVNRQVFNGDAVAEARKHLAQRSNAPFIRYPQHQFVVVVRALGQRSGSSVERGGIGEAQQDVRARDATFEL